MVTLRQCHAFTRNWLALRRFPSRFKHGVSAYSALAGRKPLNERLSRPLALEIFYHRLYSVIKVKTGEDV
jgi:hypothetical protein